MTGYVSFERRHVIRFQAMLNGSTSTIEEPFKQRLEGLLKSRIEDAHDDLAFYARRVAYTHNILTDLVERLCGHLTNEKQRCAEHRKSTQPSLVNTHLERLDELSPITLGASEALGHRLYDLLKVSIPERHDELIEQVHRVCDLLQDPRPQLRAEVVEKLTEERDRITALAESPCVDLAGNPVGPVTIDQRTVEAA